MLDVCLLGTGGTMPLKNRWLSSAIFRYNGRCILADCGEGTQIALKTALFTFKPIDVICLTHFHADHVSGLPGMLLSMGNEGRTEPVLIIGPRGTRKVVSSLRIIAPGLPFEIEIAEKPHSYEIERSNESEPYHRKQILILFLHDFHHIHIKIHICIETVITIASPVIVRTILNKGCAVLNNFFPILFNV